MHAVKDGQFLIKFVSQIQKPPASERNEMSCANRQQKKRANNTAKVQALSLDQKAHSIHISAHWPSEIPQESKVLSVCGALEKCFTNFQQEQSNIASKEISNKHPTVFFISIRASQPSLRKLSIMFSNVLHSFSLGGFLFLLGFLLCAPRREPSEFERKNLLYFSSTSSISASRLLCCCLYYCLFFSSFLFWVLFFLFCFKIMFHILNLSCSLLAGLRCLLRFLSPYDGVFYSPWQQESWVCAVEDRIHNTRHTPYNTQASCWWNGNEGNGRENQPGGVRNSPSRFCCLCFLVSIIRLPFFFSSSLPFYFSFRSILHGLHDLTPLELVLRA